MSLNLTENLTEDQLEEVLSKFQNFLISNDLDLVEVDVYLEEKESQFSTLDLAYLFYQGDSATVFEELNLEAPSIFQQVFQPIEVTPKKKWWFYVLASGLFLALGFLVYLSIKKK